MSPKIVCALCAFLPALALADDLITDVPAAPASEVWINPGFYTYHVKRDINLNDHNPGFGVEYRFSSVSALTAGHFKNSDWGHTHYLGMLWQPWAIGPVRLGGVAALFDGYPRVRDGKVFPSVLPVASVEWGRVGLAMTATPPVGTRLRAGISAQLRLKLN